MTLIELEWELSEALIEVQAAEKSNAAYTDALRCWAAHLEHWRNPQGVPMSYGYPPQAERAMMPAYDPWAL